MHKESLDGVRFTLQFLNGLSLPTSIITSILSSKLIDVMLKLVNLALLDEECQYLSLSLIKKYSSIPETKEIISHTKATTKLIIKISNSAPTKGKLKNLCSELLPVYLDAGVIRDIQKNLEKLKKFKKLSKTSIRTLKYELETLNCA